MCLHCVRKTHHTTYKCDKLINIDIIEGNVVVAFECEFVIFSANTFSELFKVGR